MFGLSVLDLFKCFEGVLAFIQEISSILKPKSGESPVLKP